MPDSSSYSYDVAISFAGENRAVAEQIAEQLRQRGFTVFYDMYEQETLWGKDLYVHLDEVYRERARFCVMLLSEHYARKLWTNHERQSAQARAFQQREEYILPVRLDGTEIPGIRSTVGYIDLRHTAVERVVILLEKKLRGSSSTQVDPVPLEKAVPQGPVIPLPHLKRTFTELDRDKFLKEVFQAVRAYFVQGLKALEAQEPAIQTDLTDIDARTFTCAIYVQGNRRCQANIWVGGGLMARDAICFSYGAQFDRNTLNDYLRVEHSDAALGLRVSGMWTGGAQYQGLLSQEQGAEYLWKRFTEALSW